MDCSQVSTTLTTTTITTTITTNTTTTTTGLAAWQVFMVYSLHQDDLQFIALYSPLAQVLHTRHQGLLIQLPRQPLQLAFYLLTVLCTVSVCDRYDIAQFSLSSLQVP